MVLGLSCRKYYETLEKITGIHVVEAGKFTAASLAAIAAQTYLVKNKLPGQFVLNNVYEYSMVKSSCIGALCTVMRTVVGEGTPTINEHFKKWHPAGSEAARKHDGKPALFTHFYDCISLYPSAW